MYKNAIANGSTQTSKPTPLLWFRCATLYHKAAPIWPLMSRALGINMNPIDQENSIEQHRRALQFSKETGKAIDIGCGSSGRIIDLMLEHRFEAEGLDFSIEMLKHAKKRHPEVVFHHADICEWNFSNKYEFISAWDSKFCLKRPNRI